MAAGALVMRAIALARQNNVSRPGSGMQRPAGSKTPPAKRIVPCDVFCQRNTSRRTSNVTFYLYFPPVPSKKQISLFSLLFLGLAGLTAVGLCLLMEYSAGGRIPGEEYYRAVYVLQKLEPDSRAEEEEIPGRVPYADDTESLLHHPDKILVLRHLADELAAARRERPKARFYEACARLALGERKAAVRLLNAYVIDAEYRASHYALLCRTLREIEDDKSLLLICREWQERDPSCREDRLRHTWAAQYNLGRYAEAGQLLRGEGACLGWRGIAYEAKTALAQKGDAEADKALEAGIAAHPESRMQILRLWSILKPLRRV